MELFLKDPGSVFLSFMEKTKANVQGSSARELQIYPSLALLATPQVQKCLVAL